MEQMERNRTEWNSIINSNASMQTSLSKDWHEI